MSTIAPIRPNPTIADILDKAAERVPGATDWMITISRVYGVVWQLDFVPVVDRLPDQSKAEMLSASTRREVGFEQETFSLIELAEDVTNSLIGDFRGYIITFFDPMAYRGDFVWTDE